LELNFAETFGDVGDFLADTFGEIFGEDCGVVPTKLAFVTPLESNCFPIYSLNLGGQATTEYVSVGSPA
jgi:hypothetical protein